jgi:hypothetical protein
MTLSAGLPLRGRQMQAVKVVRLLAEQIALVHVRVYIATSAAHREESLEDHSS